MIGNSGLSRSFQKAASAGIVPAERLVRECAEHLYPEACRHQAPHGLSASARPMWSGQWEVLAREFLCRFLPSDCRSPRSWFFCALERTCCHCFPFEFGIRRLVYLVKVSVNKGNMIRIRGHALPCYCKHLATHSPILTSIHFVSGPPFTALSPGTGLVVPRHHFFGEHRLVYHDLS